MNDWAFDRFAQLGDLAEMPILRRLWDHFPENMFVIRVEDHDEFIVEAANPSERSTLGFDCEGKTIRELLPPDTAEQVLQHYRRCLNEGDSVRYEEEAIFFDADGVERFGSWLTLLVPLRDASGRISHLFGISQDIHELRSAHEALARQNQELEARVAARTAELRAANERLQTLNEQLETLAIRDALTGVYNRGHLEFITERELARSERTGNPLCLLMLDLDDFKRINDHEGHIAGDELLAHVARILQATLRKPDLIGRYGGDEFGVVLPDTRRAQALHVAERLRRVLEQHTPITVSIGLTESVPTDRHLADVAARADQLLLGAKQAGRNRLMGK